MRTIWNGSLSFGLVTIPVGLAPATKPKARSSDVSFRTLHRECGTPIKQKRWCPFHEREVSADEIVKGWEVAKGQFVIVEDADLEALERQTDGRTIEITQFVKVEEVDPIFFDRTYFLAPGSAPAARRPYALLLQAMNEMEVAALGRMVTDGADERVPPRPARDARGQARGRGDQGAGARAGDAGHRSDGRVAAERGRRAEAEAGRQEEGSRAAPARGSRRATLGLKVLR